MPESNKLSLPLALHALVEELNQMKAEGVETLVVEPSTLDALRAKVAEVAAARVPVAPQESTASKTEGVSPSASPAPVPAPDAPPAPAVSPPLAALLPAAEVLVKGDLTPPVFELPPGSKQSQWEWLREKVLNCATCLANRNPDCQTVFGVGNLDADIFFCGEAPGVEEEQQGEPFVGPAGQKLNGMIRGMGLDRETVYIANITNWRPRTVTGFGNPSPSPQEMDFCLPYLKAQLAIVQPKVIVPLGNTAIQTLLGDPTRKVREVRGQRFDFEGVPMLPTFHPSYILEHDSNRAKRLVWEDLLKVMEHLALPISEKQRGYFL